MLTAAIFAAFTWIMPWAAEAGYALHLCAGTVALLAIRTASQRARRRPVAVVATLCAYMGVATLAALGSRGAPAVVDALNRYGAAGAYGALLLMSVVLPLCRGVYFTDAYAPLAGRGASAQRIQAIRAVSRRLSRLWSALFAVGVVGSVVFEGQARTCFSAAIVLLGFVFTRACTPRRERTETGGDLAAV